jgi:hypothetical protein
MKKEGRRKKDGIRKVSTAQNRKQEKRLGHIKNLPKTGHRKKKRTLFNVQSLPSHSSLTIGQNIQIHFGIFNRRVSFV